MYPFKKVRSILAVVMVLAIISSLGITQTVIGAKTEDDDKILSQHFKVEIEGLSQASENIESVEVEDLTVDVREKTDDDGANWDGWRQYAPGDAHYGTATLRVRVGSGSREIREWVRLAAERKMIRRDIAIVVYDRNGNEARRWTLKQTYPTKYDPGDYSPSSKKRVETITVKVSRVELASAGNVQNAKVNSTLIAGALSEDQAPITKGFRIEISGPSGGKNEDSAWETQTGGALTIEVAPASIGNNQINVTTPGHKFVDEIQLRGPMTASRKWLQAAINSTVNKKPVRFDMTVTELLPGGNPGRVFIYKNCFITRYVYPKLSADGTGSLYEEVSIKPERLEVQ